MPELTERDVTRDGIAAKLASRRAAQSEQPAIEQELAITEDEGVESVKPDIQAELFNEVQDEPDESVETETASDVEDDSETIRRLDQLSSVMPEAEWDTLKELLVEVKVDGEVSEAPLSELIANYQKRKYADKQMADAAEAKKAAAKSIEERTARLDASLTEIEDMLEVSKQELIGQNNAIDWQSLRQQDPGEFAALQADFKAKAEALAERLGSVSRKRQELTLRQQAEQAEWQKQQAQTVIEMIPGWKDEAKRSKDLQGFVSLLKEDGFQDQEIGQIHDARYAKIIWEAMQYRKLKKESPAVTQRLKFAPKQAKKTARPVQPGNTSKVADAKANLRKDPRSTRAIADLLRAKRITQR